MVSSLSSISSSESYKTFRGVFLPFFDFFKSGIEESRSELVSNSHGLLRFILETLATFGVAVTGCIDRFSV